MSSYLSSFYHNPPVNMIFHFAISEQNDRKNAQKYANSSESNPVLFFDVPNFVSPLECAVLYGYRVIFFLPHYEVSVHP